MVKNAADFGDMIRLRRREAGLTQRDLAAAVDTGERFIVELEAGKSSCQLGKALSVARALGIELTDSRHHSAADLDRDDDLPRLTGIPGLRR